jgi:hypothetical protein
MTGLEVTLADHPVGSEAPSAYEATGISHNREGKCQSLGISLQRTIRVPNLGKPHDSLLV